MSGRNLNTSKLRIFQSRVWLNLSKARASIAGHVFLLGFRVQGLGLRGISSKARSKVGRTRETRDHPRSSITLHSSCLQILHHLDLQTPGSRYGLGLRVLGFVLETCFTKEDAAIKIASWYYCRTEQSRNESPHAIRAELPGRTCFCCRSFADLGTLIVNERYSASNVSL